MSDVPFSYSSMPRLSSRSIAVLEMIAAGRSYDQILSAYPDISYLDIFHAAEEALSLAIGSTVPRQASEKAYTLVEKRERYPRAYLPWTDAEDDTLKRLVHSGLSVARIAGELQRNRGAIRSRLARLNLVESLTPKEQDRYRRIVQSPDSSR